VNLIDSRAGVSVVSIAHSAWRTFLANHVRDLVSIDFFTVPTVSLRVLFVLVVLTHDRRRVVHFNVTEHPTAQWTAQQIVDAFPDDSAPSYLLRDHDRVYGEQFRHRVRGMQIEEELTALQSPWQDPFAERGDERDSASRPGTTSTPARIPPTRQSGGRPYLRPPVGNLSV
jgi:hypothetical protein